MAWNEIASSVAVQPPSGVHVCILVPHWGAVSMEWVETTYGPLRFIPRAGYTKSTKLARGILNLDTERNELVKSGLEDKTVTHLFFLDTDCISEKPRDPNQALEMLLACNVPVISGLYRAKKQKGDYQYAMWMRNPTGGEGYAPIASWTGNFISADVIGFGAVLLKREVFEKISFPWFVWNTLKSEDFSFCEKLHQHGYEVKVFTDARFSHAGTMKVLCDSGDVHTLDV